MKSIYGVNRYHCGKNVLWKVSDVCLGGCLIHYCLILYLTALKLLFFYPQFSNLLLL